MLVSENDLFLTLGAGTSTARNENLRPLLNTNIPLISGKYGFRNHFWPPESRFLMSKSEKNAFFSKPFNGPILIFWNLILYTFLCTKIKKISIGNFFSLDACLNPMWPHLWNLFKRIRIVMGKFRCTKIRTLSSCGFEKKKDFFDLFFGFGIFFPRGLIRLLTKMANKIFDPFSIHQETFLAKKRGF